MPQKYKKKTADAYPSYSDQNYTNTALAARLQKAGVNAQVGKPTGDKKRGAAQAEAYGRAQRVAQGRRPDDVAPAVRAGNGNRPAGIVRNPSQSMYEGGQQPPRQPVAQRPISRPSMFTAPVQGPLPQNQQGFTRPQNAIAPSQPVGSFGPQAQPMGQQVMGPQGPPPGYVAPQRGAPPQPPYNPLPQNPPSRMNPVSQGAYNFGQQLGQLWNNPWGRKW